MRAHTHTPEGIAWSVATVESDSDAWRGEGGCAHSRDRGDAEEEGRRRRMRLHHSPPPPSPPTPTSEEPDTLTVLSVFPK